MQNRYSIWKNLLLAGIVLFGILYALPNLFMEDPAIQINATNEEAVINAPLAAKISEILKNAKLPYLKAQLSGENILVRFADTDLQLRARDELQTALGEKYTVALNLAPRIPKWLGMIGAYPLKKGLDLSGGVHFLLEVDTGDLLRARSENDIHHIGDMLRAANIRYAGIMHKKPQGILIRFRDNDNLEAATKKISRQFSDYTLTKIQANGELILQAVLAETALAKIYDYAIEQSLTIFQNRVNELGVSEAIVQRQGENHISVDLPGIQDAARAKEIIGKTATLRFQMVDTEHDLNNAVMGDVPLGTKLYNYEGYPILLKDQAILTGSSITYANSSFAQDGRPAVEVRLGGGGENLFIRTTAENIGKPMAVVYVETKSSKDSNGKQANAASRQMEKIISVATIQSALGMNFQITGLKTIKYAENLALLLRSGALVAPVNIIEELTVGPSAGKANIHMGIISVVVGFVLVVLFMFCYYRLFGLIANMALGLNLIFIVALLSILGATLTLPGIAGIVLTVGMAVDANVLIYERIREELRNGITFQAAIYSGYARALVTIIDANITTLIVAIILFALGSGAVKGFAVTLTIGLLTSMLTSIVFTRAIVNLIYGRKAVKNISIGIKLNAK